MRQPVMMRLWRRTLAVALASVATFSLTAAASGGASRYQDYGGDQPNQSDQCALLAAQRTGGWVCPSPGEFGP